jgi:glycosyltransferase involved in cell wall biosynthesis
VHVGLNLVYLVPGETGGTETYARELIPALVEQRSDLRLTAFINLETARALPGPWTELIGSVTVPVRVRRRIEWVRGEQQLLPGLARAAGVDVVHSLANTGPARGAFRRIVTIQDLIHRFYPEAHFGLRSAGMRLLVPLAAKRSSRVIVPSEATRDDVVRLLRVPASKIDVVPLAVEPPPPAYGDADDDIRTRYSLGSRQLVVAASAKRPHKNLLRLLEALALIPSERRPALVLPGYPTPHEEELKQRAEEVGVSADVRFVGWIPGDELDALYRAAACFVFPSLYEGFGLPVLEAMARGVPVACSDRGAIAEVAGDAARAFDPESARAIATAIESILENPGEAQRLRAAGYERARKFTWSETARLTLESYERALGSA